jgi:ABC-type amino acid transport substrate-binding protein
MPISPSPVQRRLLPVIASVLLFIGIAFLLLWPVPLLAQNAPPAATPPPARTQTPPDPASDWQRIQQAGEIIVGVSVDYPPFEYYNASFDVAGFDIELMILLARMDFELSDIATLDDLPANTRIATLAGSVYQPWVEEALAARGLPASQLFLYTDFFSAIRDLRTGRVDIVLLDRRPAEEFAGRFPLQIVGGGIAPQHYAVALRKNSTELRNRLTGALEALRSDGTLARLGAKYLTGPYQSPLDPAAFANPDLVTPTAQPAVTPTATPRPGRPLPTPTATATATRTPTCSDGMSWVADLTYDDLGMTAPPLFQPGQGFTKSWRVRNIGTCPWGPGYSLRFVQGNLPGAQMGGQPLAITVAVPPGATHDLHVPLIAPLATGTYQGFWQMVNPAGQPFGQRIWVGIRVQAPPTPAPTATAPAPGIEFAADRTAIRAGEAVTIRWQVTGASAVFFNEAGQPWQSNSVGPQGSRTLYPPRTTVYQLRVHLPDNSVILRELSVTVQPAESAPQITRCTMAPAGPILAGQCLDFGWAVQGVVSSLRIVRNGGVAWDGAPVQGSWRDCPAAAGTVEYRLEATGPGGQSRSVQTAAPPSPPAFISSFVVAPRQLQRGECVGLTWAVGGSLNRVEIYRNGALIAVDATFNGYGQDCPPTAGAVTYRLDAVSADGGQRDRREETVQVREPAPPTATPAPQAPVIEWFRASAGEITVGDCVMLDWRFSGRDLAAAKLLRNGSPIDSDVRPEGSRQECATEIGTMIFELQVAAEFGASTRQVVTVFVQPMRPQPRTGGG